MYFKAIVSIYTISSIYHMGEGRLMIRTVVASVGDLATAAGSLVSSPYSTYMVTSLILKKQSTI